MTHIEDIYSELQRATGVEDWQVKHGFFTNDLLEVPKICTTFIIVPRHEGYYYFVNVPSTKIKTYSKKYQVWANPDWYAYSGNGAKGRGSIALGSRKQQLENLYKSIEQKKLLERVLTNL